MSSTFDATKRTLPFAAANAAVGASAAAARQQVSVKAKYLFITRFTVDGSPCSGSLRTNQAAAWEARRPVLIQLSGGRNILRSRAFK